MSTHISPVKQNGDVPPAPVSYESLLEASELLLDNLGSPELNSRSIQWDNFPALMKLWEVLWQAQASLVREAERVKETLEAFNVEGARLQEIRADMDEIRASRHDERDRHFALGLYWRRHAIWRYFRTHLQQPEMARDLLHLYLVKPVGGGQQAGEPCRPKCNTKSEQTVLLDIASKQRNRIRQLGQWLSDHPEAAALLRDTKGKGKGKAREGNENDVVLKQKAHFERCLEEIESKERLRALMSSTNDWIHCFKSRLEAVHDAKNTLEILQEKQRHASSLVQLQVKQRKRPNGANTVEVHDPQTKRRRTVDRGTSPIQEIAEKSIYLERSRDFARHEVNPSEIGFPNGPVSTFPSTTTAQETALQEDDSPPSPQSLPSPPPHAQAHPRHLPQTATDESQQSTNDSSFKPPSIPSVQSLPPVQSSSSGDDGFRMTIVRDVNTTHANGVDREIASTTKIVMQPAQRPKKRVSRLPPPSLEVQQMLVEAALETERRRKEEKQRLGELDYDPWWGVQDWVPPESQGQSIEEEHKVAPMPVAQEAVQSSVNDEKSEEMHTANSRFTSTFEALDAEGSEMGSQRGREEDEARITEFLKSENL